MSINHQFIALSDKVYKRYRKTVPSALTGRRLDPYNENHQLDFILTTSPNSYDVLWTDGKPVELHQKGFDYDTEVIEIYSADEYKIFQRLNKQHIENGVLVEYSDTAPEVISHNILTDEQVIEIASIKQILSLRKRLEDINSIHTLQRIKKAAIELNRTVGILRAIDDRINDVTEE